MRNPDEREPMPEERIPEERMSEERKSEERTPEQHVSEGRMSEERTPEERASEGRMSEERVPEGRMPEERMPEERVSEERMSEERMGEQPVERDRMERDRMEREPMSAPTQTQRSFLGIPDAEAYIQRFESVQAEFIDEPRRAVEKAETLVSEAIDRMMDSLKEELHRSRTRNDGGGDETEQLRIAMKRYRDLLHSFSQRSA